MCETATDCVNLTVYKECYEENNFKIENNFCACSSWHGWTGDDCDKTGPTIKFRRFISLCFLAWTTTISVTLFNTLYHLMKFNFNKKKKLMENNPIFFVLCSAALAEFVFVISESLRLRFAFNPRFVELDVNNSVAPKNEHVYYVILTLGCFFHGCASLLIALSWLDVLNILQNMFDTSFCMSEKKLKMVIMFSGISVTLVTLASIILRLEALSNLMFLMGSLVIAISYSFTYVKFNAALKSFCLANESSRGQKNALSLIKNSFLVTIFCLSCFIFITAATIYGMTVSSKVIRINGLNYIVMIMRSAFGFLYLNITYISYYCHKITVNLTKNQSKQNWIPFISSIKRVNLSSRLSMAKIEATGW